MNIAIIADNDKKEIMAQFCIAYSGVLSQHTLCATNTTGGYIAKVTGLNIEAMLPGSTGGIDQIGARVSYNEIDAVFYFRTTNPDRVPYEDELRLLRSCDMYNIPLATNIATAECLISAIGNGDLNWREFINPTSDYSKRKRANH